MIYILYIYQLSWGIARDRMFYLIEKDDNLISMDNDNTVLNDNRLFEHRYNTYIIDSLYHCKDVKPHNVICKHM